MKPNMLLKNGGRPRNLDPCSELSRRKMLALYIGNAFVHPVVLYRTGASNLMVLETEELVVFHQKQLRSLIGK